MVHSDRGERGRPVVGFKVAIVHVAWQPRQRHSVVTLMTFASVSIARIPQWGHAEGRTTAVSRLFAIWAGWPMFEIARKCEHQALSDLMLRGGGHLAVYRHAGQAATHQLSCAQRRQLDEFELPHLRRFKHHLFSLKSSDR